MAKFTSVDKGKRVLVEGAVIQFKDGAYETDDEKVIEALKKAKHVSEDKPAKPASKSAQKADK